VIRERLRGVRYFVDDVGYALRRRFGERSERERAREPGEGPPDETAARPRWPAPLIGALAAAVVLLVVVVAAGAGPCWLPGGDACGSPDEAIELVPDDALLYAHADLEADSEQYRQAAALADRLPRISRQLLGALAGVGGGAELPADFDREVRPWFGGELALALVPTGAGGSEPVQLLEATDEEAAREYGGAGAEIVDGFLVLGSDSAVEAVTETAAGADDAAPLADDETAEDVRELLPEDRVADVFLSEEGIEELVAGGAGPLSTLEPFVDAGATRGAAAALVATDEGLELALRSSLDPERSAEDPGFFDAFPGFEPTLAGEISPTALAYVGFGDPGEAVTQLLRQAGSEAPGVAAGFSDLFDRVRELGEISLGEDLLPALGDEAALVLDLGREQGPDLEEGEPGPVPLPELPGQPPPVAPTVPVPFLELVAGGVDEQRAQEALDRLEEVFAADAGGSEPAPDAGEIGGIEAGLLELSPTIDLTYAAFDEKLVVATSPDGIRRMAEGDGGLDGTESFQQGTAGLPAEPSFLAYLNISEVLGLAELQGLGDDPAYVALAEELRALEAFAVAVDAGEDELVTDARLVIDERAR
jgi:hypothetical protein